MRCNKQKKIGTKRKHRHPEDINMNYGKRFQKQAIGFKACDRSIIERLNSLSGTKNVSLEGKPAYVCQARCIFYEAVAPNRRRPEMQIQLFKRS